MFVFRAELMNALFFTKVRFSKFLVVVNAAQRHQASQEQIVVMLYRYYGAK